jgi:hypothetical protein
MPKLVVVLIIWFTWAAGKDLDSLARFSITSDFYILSHAGVAPLFFVMSGVALFANVASVYFLFRPAIVGLKVLYSALAVALVQNAVTLTLALQDLPGVRDAYARGREIRGLLVREEALNMIFTPTGMLASFAAVIVFYIIVAILIHKACKHFQGSVEVAA